MFFDQFNKFLSAKLSFLVISLTLLTFFNFITHEKSIGIIISIPQIILVTYFLFTNRTKEAYVWHVIFSLTCIAIPFSSITAPGQGEYSLYNYSKLKLFGPIGFSQLLTMLFFLKLLPIKSKLSKESLFRLLEKMLLFFAVFGIFNGLLGLFFSDYHYSSFVTHVVYIIPLLLNVSVLKKLYSIDFLQLLRKIMFALLISSTFASLLSYILGFVSQYGSSDVIIQAEVSYYSPILLFCLLYDKHKILAFLFFCISLFILQSGGTGGKGIIIMLLIFILFLWSVFFSSTIHIAKLNRLILRFSILLFICVLVFFILDLYQHSEYSLFLYKLDSVFSLLSIFDSSDGVALLPNSPRIRVASLMNIFQEFISNPYFFFFGKGYGGYFSDLTGILANSDLSAAFPDEQVKLDQFSRPHDTFASVPLVNGLLGLVFILYVVYRYIKRIKYDYFALAVIPWLLLTFYYNFQFAYVGLLMLFLTERNEESFVYRPNLSAGTC